MSQLREVSKLGESCSRSSCRYYILLLPSVALLIGMLMLGNLFRESGVVERISKTERADQHCDDISRRTVGATASDLSAAADAAIIGGPARFHRQHRRRRPAGQAHVSADKREGQPATGSAYVPPCRWRPGISQIEGQKVNPRNWLLMHAMGLTWPASSARRRRAFCWRCSGNRGTVWTKRNPP